MNHIYRFRVRRREVVRDFSLPTWTTQHAKRIEAAVFQRFDKYRIDYRPGVRRGLFDQIIKVGISTSPKRRLQQVNDNPESGKTEYLKVGPLASISVSGYILLLWIWFTVVRALLLILLFMAMGAALTSCQPYYPAIKPLFKLPCCCRERFIECTKTVYTHEYNAMIGAGADRQTAIDTANLRAIRWVGAVQLNADRTDWGNLCDCAYWPQYSRWRLPKRESNQNE